LLFLALPPSTPLICLFVVSRRLKTGAQVSTLVACLSIGQSMSASSRPTLDDGLVVDHSMRRTSICIPLSLHEIGKVRLFRTFARLLALCLLSPRQFLILEPQIWRLRCGVSIVLKLSASTNPPFVTMAKPHSLLFKVLSPKSSPRARVTVRMHTIEIMNSRRSRWPKYHTAIHKVYLKPGASTKIPPARLWTISSPDFGS
jgi:hypothetical protein